MKIILFIFVSLLSASTLHGQDRINTSIPVIGKDVLWSLDEATGWVKNIEGQWVEGKNKIQKKNVSVGNKELWDKAPFFEGIDNFIKFELREVVVGGDKFLLLTKKMNDGRWEYPITKAG